MSSAAKPSLLIRPKTSNAAIASLLLGLASLIVCAFGLLFICAAIETWEHDPRHLLVWIVALMFPIPGLICGVVGLKRGKHSSERKKESVLALSGLALSVAALLIFPTAGPRVREATIRAHCVANLKLIAQAKENWASENAKKQTDTPVDADLFGLGTTYIREKPVCLEGGTYSLHPVNAKPTCSVPGHTI